jgi:type II secretory ATPase GspE/PulE/Tfp pilus assembly ATPase PilB-like protein
VDELLRKTILESQEADAIAKIAIQNGMRTLREAGLDRVRNGLTTIEEIMRVTSE